MYDIPHMISIDAIGRKKSIFVLFSFKFSLFSLTEILDTKYAIKKKNNCELPLNKKNIIPFSVIPLISILKVTITRNSRVIFVMRVIEVRRIEVNIAWKTFVLKQKIHSNRLQAKNATIFEYSTPTVFIINCSAADNEKHKNKPILLIFWANLLEINM